MASCACVLLQLRFTRVKEAELWVYRHAHRTYWRWQTLVSEAHQRLAGHFAVSCGPKTTGDRNRSLRKRWIVHGSHKHRGLLFSPHVRMTRSISAFHAPHCIVFRIQVGRCTNWTSSHKAQQIKPKMKCEGPVCA
ncbi:hypothetical protein AciX8_2182 [Granulicella mallensis MP5ACTX8]|uniref:Uncharacterized protein n=1 Tax=Granulicella mallensis (strain ATCC BAA-1857 / DSM 23137 / MP5ACTX8) TaxID=682795 RepID=G8NVC4_GRAMM|nr:hypothetical protein AciX8_2182 [Granulicella mallensis MP5ACTX8]